METIAKIRLLYHNQKKSVSEIARAVRMSRNTVRKYLHYDGDVPQYARERIPKPQLGPYEALLQRCGVWRMEHPSKKRCVTAVTEFVEERSDQCHYTVALLRRHS